MVLCPYEGVKLYNVYCNIIVISDSEYGPLCVIVLKSNVTGIRLRIILVLSIISIYDFELIEWCDFDMFSGIQEH